MLFVCDVVCLFVMLCICVLFHLLYVTLSPGCDGVCVLLGSPHCLCECPIVDVNVVLRLLYCVLLMLLLFSVSCIMSFFVLCFYVLCVVVLYVCVLS